LAAPEAENKLRLPCETLKYHFLDLNKVAFWDGQEGENEFKVTCESLKHRFLDFTQVAFWAVEEEVPADHLKPAFSNSPKSNFGLVKRQNMTFKCHSNT